MSTPKLLSVMCAVLLLTGPALADQTDTRLAGLFDELKAAPTHIEAAPVEQMIWSRWIAFPDASAAALMQSGIDAMGQRNLVTAVNHFTALIELSPAFAEAWNKRATAHYLAGNYQQSLEDTAKTLELEPRHFGALSGQGMVYIQLEDLPNALASFEAALSVHPNMIGASANAETIRKILGHREI